jgi:hypothetical protein
VSFNHLLEDGDLTWGDICSTLQGDIEHNSEDTKKKLKSMLTDGRKCSLGKLFSKYDMFNSMTKWFKVKYWEKLVNNGYTNTKEQFGFILDILKRYTEGCIKSKCKACAKIIIFNKSTMDIEYPVYNYGEKFYHPSCYGN